MYLKSLEMHGFKSFPDKTVIQFESGLTGVVGPNGSGKSNISDAMRWVLGEQSSKTLRGSKMEDVIFSGTKSRSPLSFAQVSLTLDNSDRSIDIDNDDVTITRKFYRSGESEYLINKQSVRLKDIHEMLMDTGLGRDGYSIIGQGKIAEILSAKSDERREIFEEAAGISKYRYRKEEAEKRLLLAEENLLRLHDILDELESRVGPLEEQSRKAKQFLELSEKKKIIEISIWNDTLNHSKDIIRDIEGKVFIAKQHHDELDEKSKSIESEIEECYNNAQQCNVSIESKRHEQQTLREDVSEKKSQVAVLENDIGHNRENIDRIENELGSFANTADSIDAQIKEKNSQRDLLSQKLSLVTNSKDEAIRDLTDCKNNEIGYSSKITELTDRIGQLSKETSDNKVTVFSCESASKEISSSLVAAKDKEKQIAEELAKQNSLVDQKNIEITALDDQIMFLQNSVQGSELKLGMKKEKLAEVATKLNDTVTKVQGMKQKLRLMKELENSMEGFSESVKTIIGESTKGHLRGIHGVVSKLIHVEDKHSVAIETALGGALQNIIVENEDSAKACINYLKEKKAGRATFLPITSVDSRGKLSEDLSAFEGYVGIASDLIQCDSKYDKIILNLLGRTAVVEDIDTAVLIAKKCSYRFRIVTLDGQVVNAGGSLTGGSLIRNSGLLGRAGQIDKLSGEIRSNENEIAKLEELHEKAKRDMDTAQAETEALNAEIQTISEELVRLRYEAAAYQKSIVDLETSKTENSELSNHLEHRLADLNTKIREADQTGRNLASEIEALTVNLSEYTELAQQISQSVKEKTEIISEYRLKELELQKDIESNENEINILKESHLSAQNRRDALLSQVDELKLKNVEIEEQIKMIDDTCKEIDIRIVRIDGEITGIIAKRTSYEKQATDLRSGVRDLSNDKESLSKDIARLEERLETSKNEYDVIVARLWDEYEITRSEAAAIAHEITDMNKAKRELNDYKNKIKSLGSVNVGAIDEYKEVHERYEFMHGQITDVEKSKQELFSLVNELTEEMKKSFLTTFEKIDRNFSKVFAELFGGGTAHLSLSDPEDILSSGIEISVEPPGKIIKSLTMLSGGEQAFVAIAIYFSILKVKPAPFCILDEIEAALDDVNVYKYASYLRRMNKRTQFISITHRRGTMEECDVLYGITMQHEGVSKILKLDIEHLEEHLALK